MYKLTRCVKNTIWRSLLLLDFYLLEISYTHGDSCVNIGNIVLTIVKLEDLWSLLVIGLRKFQTQNLLFTFTWNVKKAQNNFVPIFNSKVGVRLIHECDLYSSKYGNKKDNNPVVCVF